LVVEGDSAIVAPPEEPIFRSHEDC